jgi:hypothetical protein
MAKSKQAVNAFSLFFEHFFELAVAAFLTDLIKEVGN